MASGVKVDRAHLHVWQVLWVVGDAAVADVDKLLLEDAYHTLRDEGLGYVSNS